MAVNKIRKDGLDYDIHDTRLDDGEYTDLVYTGRIQTLTNKSLTAPVITDPTINGTIKTTSVAGIKSEAPVVSFKPFSIQYSAQGTESGADTKSKWTIYPTSSEEGSTPSKLSVFVTSAGLSPVIEIGRSTNGSTLDSKLVLSTNIGSDGSMIPVLETYSGQSMSFQWAFPTSQGTLALTSQVDAVTSRVNTLANTVTTLQNNSVTVTGNQTVGGIKTFVEDIVATGISGSTSGSTTTEGFELKDSTLKFTTETSEDVTYTTEYTRTNIKVGSDVLTLPNKTGTLLTDSHFNTTGSSFFAPTSSATNSKYLIGGGANSAPIWQDKATTVTSGSTKLVTSGAVYNYVSNLPKSAIYRYRIIMPYDGSWLDLVVYTTKDVDAASIISSAANFRSFLLGISTAAWGHRIGPIYIDAGTAGYGLVPVVYTKSALISDPVTVGYFLNTSTMSSDVYSHTNVYSVDKTEISLEEISQ